MCTVTLIRTDVSDSFGYTIRLVFNRDELRTRVPSLPLRIVRQGTRKIAMPVDPLSNGSWIGASDAGMVACLLNANPVHQLPDTKQLSASAKHSQHSRGRMIPIALCADSVEYASEAVGNECDADTLPFTLVILDHASLAIIRWNGKTDLVEYSSRIPTRLMLTSSGLGDHLVEAPRRHLYEQLFANALDLQVAQDDFHKHRCVESGYSSVLMSRAEARTVSQTIVTLDSKQVQFSHSRLDDLLDPVGSPEAMVLPLAGRRHD